MENMKVDADAWPVRAAAWELLALSFRYPDAVLVDAIVSGEWADAAVEIAAALGAPLSEGFGSDLADADPEAFLHTLRAEATRLFIGSPEPAASPYEGVHRAEADGVQALLFVNPHSMAVERFMKSCGLGRPEGTNEPLDHVATECEFLQLLCMLASGVPMPENTVDPVDLPTGSPEGAYATFMEEHAGVWMPGFAEQVQAESRVPFFRDAALLMKASICA